MFISEMMRHQASNHTFTSCSRVGRLLRSNFLQVTVDPLDSRLLVFYLRLVLELFYLCVDEKIDKFSKPAMCDQ